MSETAHTPGPWKAGSSYVQTDNGVFCVVAQTYTGCDVDRIDANANARLIAVAPDLLMALAWLVGMQGKPLSDDHDDELMLAIAGAEAAIKKATGAA